MHLLPPVLKKPFYKFLLGVSLFGLAINSNASSVPVQEWDKAFGAAKEEGLAALQPTSDGGYIVGGTSDSDPAFKKNGNALGNADFWLVKTDFAGNRLWDKTFGGAGLETLHTLAQTTDGGFILGGSSQSGISETKSEENLGSYDFWVIKTDAEGNKLWDKTLGGENYDFLYSVAQTPDGGFVVSGVSFSNAAVAGSAAGQTAHYLIIKLDAAGNQVWTRKVENIDAEAEEPFVMHLTADNGFILAGSLNNDGKVSNLATKGASDFHLIKLDAAGNREWEHVYGSKNDEFLSSLQLTADGGYILGGISHSGKGDDKSDAGFGKGDFWIIKVDRNGKKLWDKTFGGSDYDYLAALQQTDDEGYLLGGISRSGKSGDKSQSASGRSDFWIVKLDANGNKVYEQAYGGSKDDELYALTQTLDGGILLAGNSTSGKSSGKTEDNEGGKDIWLVKLKVPVISWSSF